MCYINPTLLQLYLPSTKQETQQKQAYIVTLSFSFVPLFCGDGKHEGCMHGCGDVHGRHECTHGTSDHVRASG